MQTEKEIEYLILDDAERQPCEIWTRVMGYLRPKNWFNRGKKSEFDERKYFSEEKAVERMIQDGDINYLEEGSYIDDKCKK